MVILPKSQVLLFFTIIFSIQTTLIGQNVENLRFEQIDKQIIIYFDLPDGINGQTYDVQVYYSIDGGTTFNGPLKQLSGDFGTKVIGGAGKKVVWDVLQEKTELIGNIIFEIQIRKEMEGYGHLKVTAPNSQIWLNNELAASENLSKDLEAGEYALKATRGEDYYEEVRFITVRPGDYLEYSFNLKPKYETRFEKDEALNVQSNFAIISAGHGISYGSSWGIRVGFLSGNKVRVGLNGSVGVFKQHIQYAVGLRVHVYKEWAIIGQYGTNGYIYNEGTGEFLYLQTGVSLLLGYDWFFSKHVGITWGIGAFYDTNFENEFEFVADAGIIFRF